MPADAMNGPSLAARSKGKELPHNEKCEDPRLSALLPPSADTVEWQVTIQIVVRSVVSIRFSHTRPFDGTPARTSEATGFVVDAEKGCVFPRVGPTGAGLALISPST